MTLDAASEVPAAAPERSWSRVRFGHIWVDALRFDEALEQVAALVRKGAGGCVFTPNVDHVVLAEDDEEFRAGYARAALSLPDGQPIVWASRLVGLRVPEKVSGSDLAWPLMERAAREGWRVYLLGGAPGVAEEVAGKLRRELGVEIVGTDSPMLSVAGADAETDAAVERLRAARPDLVLVALGSPKQERWIHRNLERLAPAVAVGVGASLDFIAGRARRSPQWVSRLGMEWLFRLALEPRRLAGRYLVRDPRFVGIVARTVRAPLESRVARR
jgi:N-acetylglucosaminyldiphosphoundecaprenol N-acetyl-beta-D-mannosaminyltransferase